MERSMLSSNISFNNFKLGFIFSLTAKYVILKVWLGIERSKWMVIPFFLRVTR